MKLHPLLLAIALAAPAFAEDKPATPATTPDATVFAPKDLEKLKEQLGKPVVVEGTIAAQGENKTASIRYLNFSRNYKETISLVFVVGKSGDEFSKEKLEPFVGKKVRVSGTVGIYNDALQIKIDKLDQIQIQP